MLQRCALVIVSFNLRIAIKINLTQHLPLLLTVLSLLLLFVYPLSLFMCLYYDKDSQCFAMILDKCARQ